MAARDDALISGVEPPGRQPLHRVVAEELLAGIADGTYAVGDRLPTEEELCLHYGISRGTARQALERLRQLGMISRRARVGTVVVSTTPGGFHSAFATTQADIEAFAATTRLVRPERLDITLDGPTARRIGARAGTSWHLLRGVRVRRDEPDTPLCWSEHYNRGDTVDWRDLTAFTPAPSEFQMEQQVYADLLDERLAKKLRTDPGSPALVVMRRVHDKRGRLLHAGLHTHPADRYQITTVMEPRQ